MSRDLLEQSVVKGVEVREDDGISLELCTVLGQSGGEVIEGPFFVGSGNCAHGLYIRSGKLYAAPSFSRREILETNVQGKDGVPSIRDPTSSAADDMILQRSMYLSASTAFGVSKF